MWLKKGEAYLWPPGQYVASAMLVQAMLIQAKLVQAKLALHVLH